MFPSAVKGMSPVEYMGHLLVELRRQVNAKPGDTVEAVLSYPQVWTTAARFALFTAARLAGITVNAMVPEPVSIALGHFKQLDGSCIRALVVLDLGGGTFDLALVVRTWTQATGEFDFKIEMAGGNRELGGHLCAVDLAERLLEKACGDAVIAAKVEEIRNKGKLAEMMQMLRDDVGKKMTMGM